MMVFIRALSTLGAPKSSYLQRKCEKSGGWFLVWEIKVEVLKTPRRPSGQMKQKKWQNNKYLAALVKFTHQKLVDEHPLRGF